MEHKLDKQNGISLAPKKWALYQTLWTILPPVSTQSSNQKF